MENKIKETLLDAMADLAVQLFPKPARSLNDNNLCLISSIAPAQGECSGNSWNWDRENAYCVVFCPAALWRWHCCRHITSPHFTRTPPDKRVSSVSYPLSGSPMESTAHMPMLFMYLLSMLGLIHLPSQISLYFNAFQVLKPFYRDLQWLEHEGCLALIVFDKIHKVLTDSKYCNTFSYFWVLNLVKTPIFGLSGLLPPSAVPKFFSLTNTTWRVIRTPSNRSELGYEIHKTLAPLATAIVKYIPKYISQYRSEDCLMVFCWTHQHVETLAEALGVPEFSSHTMATNDTSMDNWRKGRTKIMVLTSILECGLNYSHVHHIIHCNTAYSMLDQHQQESRAGHNGQEAKAITYVPVHQFPPRIDLLQMEYGTQDLYEWTQHSTMSLCNS